MMKEQYAVIHPRGETERMPKILVSDLKPGFLGIEVGDMLSILIPVERGNPLWMKFLVINRYQHVILTKCAFKECFSYAELAVLHLHGELKITRAKQENRRSIE